MEVGIVKAAFLLLAGIGFMVISSEFRGNVAKIVSRLFGRNRKSAKNVAIH